MLAVLFFGVLYRAARFGPDFEHYWDWGEAAASGDIFRLRGGTQSPMGVPASIWAHGVGMMLASPKLVLGGALGTAGKSVVVGWLAAVAFWWAMVRLLVLAAKGSTPHVLFGTALVFLGTGAGHYSTVHATESFSLALVALLGLWVLAPGARRASDGLVVGLLSGLLLVTRLQLVPYVLLALCVLFARWRRQGALHSLRHRTALAGATLLPIAIACAQVAFVNRWMTGSPIRSPWSFGSTTFSSMDVADPEWLAVLFHPWHGAVTYHPLYAVALLALGAAVARSRMAARARLLYVGLAAVLASQVAVQASWFCWWMGVGSFGMRSMTVSAVVLVPTLIARMAERDAAGRSSRAWLVACCLATIWSYLLLLRGESNFSDLGALLEGQAVALRTAWLPLAAVTGVSVVLIARDRSPHAALVAASAALWALAVTHLYESPRYTLPRCSPAVLAAGATVVALVLHQTFRRLEFRSAPGPLVSGVVALSVALLYVMVTISFVRVAIDAERFIGSGQPPRRPFRCLAPVPVEQITTWSREYGFVPGFEDKKAALAAYLGEACAAPP